MKKDVRKRIFTRLQASAAMAVLAYAIANLQEPLRR